MKKLLVGIFFCAIAGFAGAQSVSLDRAVKNAAGNVENTLPRGTVAVVLNFASPSDTLSAYLVDELTAALVNGKKLVLVDRRNLEEIQKELDYQMSGEVSDESAQAIGKKLGAQSIISGAFTDLGGAYRLRVRTINVTTAEIEALFAATVEESKEIRFMIPAAGAPAASPRDPDEPPEARQPTVPSGGIYKIGDYGPAGGIVFYDKGNASGGWRYLEAAPAELETVIVLIRREWSDPDLRELDRIPTSMETGSGKKNTQAIRDELEVWEIAAPGVEYCAELEYDGFADWFVPSFEELQLMYNNLYKNGWGEFSPVYFMYMSSSLEDNWLMFFQTFLNGKAGSSGKIGVITQMSLRPVRAF
jgi:hypothetical protein